MDAMNAANILDLPSLIYSQVINTVIPSLLPTEMMYLALFSISSGVSPGSTKSQSIHLGSMVSRTLKKRCPLRILGSLKLRTLYSSATLSLAQC